MHNPHESLKEELQFRLSLLRLMTEPHPDQRTQTGQESRQMEELVVLVPRDRLSDSAD